MLVNPSDQQLLLQRIVESGISVREAEDMAARVEQGEEGSGEDRAARERPRRIRKVPELREIEQKLIEKLGTKVEVRGTAAKGG